MHSMHICCQHLLFVLSRHRSVFSSLSHQMLANTVILPAENTEKIQLWIQILDKCVDILLQSQLGSYKDQCSDICQQKSTAIFDPFEQLFLCTLFTKYNSNTLWHQSRETHLLMYRALFERLPFGSVKTLAECTLWQVHQANNFNMTSNHVISRAGSND